MQADHVIKLLNVGHQARLLNLERQNNYDRSLLNSGVGWIWSNNVRFFPVYKRDQWKH